MDAISLTPSEDLWLADLRASGYHLTRPRRAVVQILADSARALQPVEIYDLGREHYPGLGLVTVYRTLERLEALGLVQRVHQESGCHTYLRAARGHEHVLLCNSCGRAEYFSGDDLNGLIRSVSQRSGFQIQGHWLQLEGTCPICQQREVIE